RPQQVGVRKRPRPFPTRANAAKRSLIGRELEIAAGGRGRTVVPPRSEFDLAIHDPEIEPVDEPAIAALLAKVLLAGPCPFSIGDDVVVDALAHDGCAPQGLEISQCEMPARKPTRPDTAMMAQRTPLACSRMACISSTLADIRSSSSSMWETFCSSTARRSLEERAGLMA